MSTLDIRLNRVTIALHDPAYVQPTLADAAALANLVQAELAGLLIEDEDVCQLASLPFASEIVRGSGLPRALNPDALERQLRIRARRLRRAFHQLEADMRLRTTLRIVRGRLQARAAAAELPADVVFLVRRPATTTPRAGNGPAGRGSAPLAVYYDESPSAGKALAVGAALQKIRVGPLLVLTTKEAQVEEISAALVDTDYRLLRVEPHGAPEALAIRHGCRLLVLPARGPADSTQLERELGTVGLPIALVA